MWNKEQYYLEYDMIKDVHYIRDINSLSIAVMYNTIVPITQQLQW